MFRSLRKLAFEPATPARYARWLEGYMERGVTFTHVYDYPLPHGFVVALKDFTLDGECGARSLSIIVPAGIEHIGGGLGHNELFYEENFTTAPGRVRIPVYGDEVFSNLPGVKEARGQALVERRAIQKQQEERQRMMDASDSDVSLYYRRMRESSF